MADKGNNNWVVTIGREFGSGGREIGRLIAKGLGIDYYDKELLFEASKQSGMNETVFEAADERSPRFFGNPLSLNIGITPSAFYTTAPVSNNRIYEAQSDVMQHIADRGPCVIVGRTADYVLRSHCKVLSIFIHAPLECCVERIMRRSDCKSAKEARQLVQKKNKLRANYYNFYTDKQWGAASSYDLCIDSSVLGSEGTARLIIDFVKNSIIGKEE